MATRTRDHHDAPCPPARLPGRIATRGVTGMVARTPGMGALARPVLITDYSPGRDGLGGWRALPLHTPAVRPADSSAVPRCSAGPIVV